MKIREMEAVHSHKILGHDREQEQLFIPQIDFRSKTKKGRCGIMYFITVNSNATVIIIVLYCDVTSFFNVWI